ncbi:MAG TPA: pyridoxamine 5'-phosphate oxidase [Gammaproteobacteria bacterium]|jgi:pyridoxamine 5'-phosphate oxidase|nr:pyridoxamine 5'-phosphate oxidase [Gammaproteobacteria bacterium]
MQQTSDKLYTEALGRFSTLLERAKADKSILEPTAMTLATVAPDGRPTARIVLLKHFDARGFVFYTNKQSHKGHDLGQEPRAALVFHWQPLLEQVRVEGVTESVTDAEADAYWASRKRISQIGAWASQQSEEMPDKDTLRREFARFEKQFEGTAVPRPSHWSGFRLVPNLMEFWSSREGRLHERERYLLGDSGWRHTWMYP